MIEKLKMQIISKIFLQVSIQKLYRKYFETKIGIRLVIEVAGANLQLILIIFLISLIVNDKILAFLIIKLIYL